MAEFTPALATILATLAGMVLGTELLVSSLRDLQPLRTLQSARDLVVPGPGRDPGASPRA